jgi:hypothetical protein
MRQALMLAGMLAGLMSVGVIPAYAAADVELKTVDKACWAEIFEDTDFDKNDPHIAIQGPAEISTLKDFSAEIGITRFKASSSVPMRRSRPIRIRISKERNWY